MTVLKIDRGEAWEPELGRKPGGRALAKPLSELAADPELLREPLCTISHMVIQGATTLLSGREKLSGKTTLASHAVAAYLDGRTFLGADPLKVALASPGAVLWYAIDEPLRDTVQRFNRLVVDAPDYLYICDTPRTLDELRAQMRADLAWHDGACRLVVIDTLSRALESSGIDSNETRTAGPAVRSIVDLLREFAVAGLLIYHASKGRGEYSGSVAIGAAVDEILTLRRRRASVDEDSDVAAPPDDGKRWLECNGRRLRGTHALGFDGKTYTLLDGENASRAVRILRAALSENGPFRKGELAGLAGGRKVDTLAEIDGLRAQGYLAELDGRYRITPSGRTRIGAE